MEIDNTDPKFQKELIRWILGLACPEDKKKEVEEWAAVIYRRALHFASMDFETNPYENRMRNVPFVNEDTDETLGACVRKHGKIEIRKYDGILEGTVEEWVVFNGSGYLRMDVLGRGQTLEHAATRAINGLDVFQ